MSRPLKLWNGRGDGDWARGHFYICAPTLKDAATMLAQVTHPNLVGRDDFAFFINRAQREITVYFGKGCWGNSMSDIKQERGIWAQKHYSDKPVRLI